MIEAEARTKLADMVAATVFPVISDATLTRELREARRIDPNLWLPSDNPEFETEHQYELGDVVEPTVRNGHVYAVIDDGLSGNAEPDWPTDPDGLVTSFEVTFQEVNSLYSAWVPTYDLNRAAATLWRIKAASVSNRHAFGSNAGNYNPEQVYQHCIEMAEYYTRKIVSSIVLRSDAWDGQGRLNAAHYDDAV